MSEAINEIVRFQTDRDLHLKEYDPLNEHGNIIEEILESAGFDVPKENRPDLKTELNVFLTSCALRGVAIAPESPEIPTHDIVDAYCDIIVFSIGAILKLGYNPEKALLEVGKEINSREGSMVDGKFEKDLSDEAKAKWYKADYDNAVEAPNE